MPLEPPRAATTASVLREDALTAVPPAARARARTPHPCSLCPCQISGIEARLRSELGQDGAEAVEVHVPLADLEDPPPVEALRIPQVQVRRVRGRAFATGGLESRSRKWLAASRVCETSTHMRMPCAAQKRRRLLWEHEDVLVALPAEMPRERRHGLRDELDAVAIGAPRGSARKIS